jgi:hypothetical protein
MCYGLPWSHPNCHLREVSLPVSPQFRHPEPPWKSARGWNRPRKISDNNAYPLIICIIYSIDSLLRPTPFFQLTTRQPPMPRMRLGATRWRLLSWTGSTADSRRSPRFNKGVFFSRVFPEKEDPSPVFGLGFLSRDMQREALNLSAELPDR